MVILGVLVFFLGAMAIAGSNFGVLKFSFDVLGSILSPKAERIAAATGEPVITPAGGGRRGAAPPPPTPTRAG